MIEIIKNFELIYEAIKLNDENIFKVIKSVKK